MLFIHTIHIYLRQHVSYLYALYYMYTCKYIGFCTRIFRKNTPSFSLPLKIRPHSTYHCSTAHTNTLMMQCMVSFRRAGRHCTGQQKMAMPAWRRCWSSTEPHGRRALRGMGAWRGGAWVECHSIPPSVVQVNERQADRHADRQTDRQTNKNLIKKLR